MVRKALSALSTEVRSVVYGSWVRRKHLTPVPVYHHTSSSLEKANGERDFHNVSPANLERQLKFLMGRYAIVDLDELVEAFLRRKNVETAIAITCDDGCRSVLTEGAPIFRGLGLHFTFFLNGKVLNEKIFWRDRVRRIIEMGLVADFVKRSNLDLDVDNFYRDSKGHRLSSKLIEEAIESYFRLKGIEEPRSDLYCDWDDIAQAGPGVRFGNHSYGHYVLSSLGRDEQFAEIARNQKLIRERTGEESVVFSVPFGNPHSYNETTLELIKDLGYKGYLTAGRLPGECRPLSIDRFGLVRIERFMPPDKPVIRGIPGHRSVFRWRSSSG